MEAMKIMFKTKNVKKEIKLMLKKINKNKLTNSKVKMQLKTIYDEIFDIGIMIFDD